jgi:hypothetical protein
MKALTTNDLLTGEAVFWSEGRWVLRFADAELLEGEAAETALAAAIAQPTTWAGDPPYLIDLQETPEGIVPLSFRERVRALGPTNKPEHGKQAEGGADVAALAHARGAARSTGRISLIRRH